jgi:hypothetical protein
MVRKMESGVPEFQSLEEEREYWEARGPLAEGHKGKFHIQEPCQKRNSFLSIRLTGDEIGQLRDVADKMGVSPSTLARFGIKQVIEQFSVTPLDIIAQPNVVIEAKPSGVTYYEEARRNLILPTIHYLLQLCKIYGIEVQPKEKTHEVTLQSVNVSAD